MDRNGVENTLKRAMDRFNYMMDTRYSLENVRVDYFNSGNAPEVYERFCGRYFPDRLAEDYHAPGFFGNAGASAFIGDGFDGILCNEQFCGEIEGEELYLVFLHELSHIFCCHNEINGGNFYRKYCCNNGDDTYTDGIINAGYAVWREFIADVMADCVYECNTGAALREARGAIMQCWTEITHENPDAKMYMSKLLSLLITSREIAPAHTWGEVKGHIQKLRITGSEAFYSLARETWENLYRGEYWEISRDFIYSLGNLYLAVLAEKYMDKEQAHGRK